MKLILSLVALSLFQFSSGDEVLPGDSLVLPSVVNEGVPDATADGASPSFFFGSNDDEDCGETPSTLINFLNDDERIVGGFIVPQWYQPWAGELYILTNVEAGTIGGLCTCSLINKQWILTAAHCVNGFAAANLTAVFGNFTRFEGETYTGIELKIHEGYTVDPVTGNNVADLAVVKLDREVTYSDTIKPICLSNKPASEYNFQTGAAAGWGRTSTGAVSFYLKQGLLTVAGQELCSRNEGYPLEIKPGQMCGFTGYTENSICQGDSGGPFMIVDGGKTYQLGVSSMVAGDCGIYTNGPNIFADVYYYRSWIVENTPVETQTCFFGIFCF